MEADICWNHVGKPGACTVQERFFGPPSLNHRVTAHLSGQRPGQPWGAATTLVHPAGPLQACQMDPFPVPALTDVNISR